MTELQWEPSKLAGLTVAQLLCLLTPRCPDPNRIDNPEDFARFAEALTAEERAWSESTDGIQAG